MGNPFKSRQFRDLFKAWNLLLEATGHKEIENFDLEEAPLKDWEGSRWSKPSEKRRPEDLQVIQQYYQKAQEILETHAFQSEFHKEVWELHCQGLAVRKISKILGRKKFSKSTVHTIIVLVERMSGLRNG